MSLHKPKVRSGRDHKEEVQKGKEVKRSPEYKQEKEKEELCF